MTLQTMYDWIRTHPGATANLPRDVRRAPVGVPYLKAARLVTLGYLRREYDGRVTRYWVTDNMTEYRHAGTTWLVPGPAFGKDQG